MCPSFTRWVSGALRAGGFACVKLGCLVLGTGRWGAGFTLYGLDTAKNNHPENAELRDTLTPVIKCATTFLKSITDSEKKVWSFYLK